MDARRSSTQRQNVTFSDVKRKLNTGWNDYCKPGINLFLSIIGFVPITLPYRALQYSRRKLKKSNERLTLQHNPYKHRDGLRISLIALGAVGGMGLGAVYGSMLGTLIFPGIGSAFGGFIGGLWGIFAGFGLGSASGVFASKMITKAWNGLVHLAKKASGSYIKDKDPALGMEMSNLPPVKYSKAKKYQPNAIPQKIESREFYTDANGQQINTRDVWKIMHTLKVKKAENKKKYNSFLASLFPHWVSKNYGENDTSYLARTAKRYAAGISLNQEFNGVIRQVRNLDISTTTSSTLTPDSRPTLPIDDSRQTYWLKFGSFYYGVKAAGNEQTLAEMRSEEPIMLSTATVGR